MNQQVFSILFSVLLASTFIHEIKARGTPNSIFGPIRAKRDINSGIQDGCRMVCSDNIPQIVDSPFPSILVNDKLYAIARLELDFGIIVDPLSNIFVIILGSTSEIVVFNIATNEGKYIRPEVLGDIVSFKRYFRSLRSNGLTNLFELRDTVSFRLDAPLPNVYNVVNQVIPYMIDRVGDQLRLDPSVGVQIIVQLMQELVQGVDGNLLGVAKFIGAQTVNLPCDLPALVTFIQGFGTVIGKTAGSIDALYRKGADLQISEILDGKGGVETLRKILVVIGNRFDVGPLLAPVVNDPTSLFTLLAQLDGPNSVFQVFANIISFIKGKSQLETLIYVLIEYITALSTQQTPACYDIIESLRGSLPRFLSTLEKVKATRSFSNAIFLLRKLLDGNLYIDGVNMSDIVKILNRLRHGETVEVLTALEVIVQVLVALQPIADTSISIPSLVLVLLGSLNSQGGLGMVQKLGFTVIDLSAPELIGRATNPNPIFLLPVTNILAFLMGDMYSAFRTIPIIGQFVDLCNLAVSRVGGNIDFRGLFNGSVPKGWFRAFFQVFGGRNLNASEDDLQKVKDIILISKSVKTLWITVPSVKYLTQQSC